ncbi:hypothetical protein ACROYT_G014468 [Oculina patagonica]
MDKLIRLSYAGIPIEDVDYEAARYQKKRETGGHQQQSELCLSVRVQSSATDLEAHDHPEANKENVPGSHLWTGLSESEIREREDATITLRMLDKQGQKSSEWSSHPKNPRVNGEPCTGPPPSSPQWALATADRQEDQRRSPSTQPLSPIVQSPLSTPGHDIDSSDDNNHLGLIDNEIGVLDSPVTRHKTRRIRVLRD